MSLERLPVVGWGNPWRCAETHAQEHSTLSSQVLLRTEAGPWTLTSSAPARRALDRFSRRSRAVAWRGAQAGPAVLPRVPGSLPLHQPSR